MGVSLPTQQRLQVGPAGAVGSLLACGEAIYTPGGAASLMLPNAPI